MTNLLAAATASSIITAPVLAAPGGDDEGRFAERGIAGARTVS